MERARAINKQPNVNVIRIILDPLAHAILPSARMERVLTSRAPVFAHPHGTEKAVKPFVMPRQRVMDMVSAIRPVCASVTLSIMVILVIAIAMMLLLVKIMDSVELTQENAHASRVGRDQVANKWIVFDSIRVRDASTPEQKARAAGANLKTSASPTIHRNSKTAVPPKPIFCSAPHPVQPSLKMLVGMEETVIASFVTCSASAIFITAQMP